MPLESLKSCPFCGKSAILNVELTGHKNCFWWVECNNCGSMTKKCFNDQEMAIKAWNRRYNVS